MEHIFTASIKDILKKHFGDKADTIFNQSLIIQYINQKTKSANKGSKSRSSFANLYAIYVIIEDYISHGFIDGEGFSTYEGAQFVNLLNRQRELPFGSKLQNHALNNRLNAEFEKFFPTSKIVPIIRDLETNRYWINENLILIQDGEQKYNIATVVIEIIDEYVKAKRNSFEQFIKQCEIIQSLDINNSIEIRNFIFGLLATNVDARLFEIVSYSILKFYYQDQKIIWGYDIDNLNIEHLKLYKTGRTNANDGGIDFVMKPLGRFFQVTETLDFKKYFLDIDKIERYPITFVVKSDYDISYLKDKLRNDAIKTYIIESVVDKYMNCIEELINISILKSYFEIVESNGMLSNVLNEIILQSKVEFKGYI